MFDSSPDSQKIALTCRFIQHDQWLTTHIEPSWTIRQLKLWLIHRLFAIPIPQRIFLPPPSSGKAPERPPSPITFAPDPRTRPASPIIFAPPQKSGFYGSVTGRGWLSDTDEELLSGDDSGTSSSAILVKKKSRMMTISVGPGGSHSDSDSPPIPSTQYPRSPTSSTPAATSPSITPFANPDVDKFPGGINPSHWTLIRYSTGQLLPDEDLISWNDIHEFELVELHGPSLSSTHILYEYQVCHLWNPERHLQERERLKGKLKKQFQLELNNSNKHASSRDKNKERDKGDNSRAAYHTQVLKAMSLDSSTGTNLGVVEYYGQRLGKAKVAPSLTRIPRSIDVYAQPYWEGWVRTLRIVYRGNPHEVAFLSAMGGGPGGPSTAVGGGGAGSSNSGMGQGMQDAHRYGTGPMPNGFGMGPQFGYFGPGERNPHLHNPPGSTYPRDFKLVRVEWRERWVKIQNGYLIVLREPNNEEATHVLPLKNIISLMDTHHLVRYLSYSGFNPPLDHPSVNQDILAPAISLPIHRPQRPSHGYFDESSSDESTVNRHHRRGAHSSHGPSSHHGLGHHSSGSWPGGGVGGVIAGGGVGSERGGKEYNFDFRDASYLHQHMKARELTPLVGSRFDPTYLPITIEEQKASGLRVVCLQFRKPTASSTSTSTTTKPSSSGGGNSGGISNHIRKKSKLEQDEEREKAKERERAKENEVEPSALALEDMKERAGEWGGLRSNNPLWRCPPRLRRDPIYIYRFKSRMRTRYSRGTSSMTMGTTMGTGSRGRGAGTKSRGSSSSKAGNQDFLSVGGGRSQQQQQQQQHRHHHRHHHHHYRQQPPRKQRVYSEKDAILAAHLLGGPLTAEDKERKAEKARRKREKQEEKERLKHEKELRESGSGVKEKEKDWKLGSLNVDFWNWGKKKKKAKQEKEMKMRLEEHERQIEEHFAAASASAYGIHHAATGSSTTIEASTVTAIGSSSGIRSAGPSSDEDGTHWDRGRSETSNVDTTEEDDDDDDEGSEDDGEEKEVKDEEGDEEEYDGVPEPYPDAIPLESPPFRDEDEEEEIEHAGRWPADSPDPSISIPEIPSPDEGGESLLTPGPNSVTSVVVQVEVDKRVETETETEDVNRRRSRTVTASFKGKELRRLSSSFTGTEEQNERYVLSGRQLPGHHRLVGQLHTSDDERNEFGDGQQGDDDSDLSSPIFAPPPSVRRFPIRAKHNDKPGSVSSHRSSTSFDASSTTGGETDEDLTFDNEFPDFKRSGYRYGLYNNRKEGEKTRYRREMEEQKVREAKIREQQKTEEREVLLERERVERDRERRERRKKEEEGEWVCLDLANDFAFGSFLRIVHQHCPHPMKSTFLERMLGGPLNDHPPPPQSAAKNPPTSLQSIFEGNDTPVLPTGRESTPSREPTKSRITSMPMPPSTPSITAHSDDSEAEYVTPLAGYGDPRFQYPSRISATVPYPEWRLNVLRKAQRAGTGDVGRAMEMLYWGREDPVIAGASGVVNEFERLAKRWESDRGGVPGFRSYDGGGSGGGRRSGKGKGRESSSGTEDNVSSLGTIGPMTVGSSGTVTASSRRMSTSGRSIQSATSPKHIISEVPQEGGDSGNESSGEDSEGDVSTTSDVGGDGRGRGQRKHKKRISMRTRLVDWSDDEDNTSELEWVGWQMDLQRQAKRQYAIQARREVESTWESDAELADLGLPINPNDDMKKYIKNRYQLEPEARIILGENSRDTQTMLLSASTQISSTSASLNISSPLSRVTTSDTLGSQHTRTPSQNSHTLHHSASLHTGLKKDNSSPLRRPSMPTLNVSVHHENRVERGKSRDRSFWDITSLGSSNDEPKSPTIPITKHGWFTIGGSSRDREGMSPGGGSVLQAGSVGGSTAGRSGNMLLGRSKLKKKDLSEQERERGKGIEVERETGRGQQRPQLRVTTSPSVGSPSNAAVAESIKSPTLGNRRLTRMQSDASILSNVEVSPPSHTKKRRVMGKLRELADSSIDFVEGK